MANAILIMHDRIARRTSLLSNCLAMCRDFPLIRRESNQLSRLPSITLKDKTTFGFDRKGLGNACKVDLPTALIWCENAWPNMNNIITLAKLDFIKVHINR
ncbi:LOW QUALITY PROTEIN: hypothetical protein PHPALM_37001 [Phytophthora palmivora]|uniref:Uncharacterized protein n=1 Tax=Phytophthora palmivora TaxID=4796 RepID=A0A2P4WYI5_9STRA|nr:LOW QUALITY PROTEIN: hypothetical protein PHPALM_37001 [Phytophthora palmivora]